MITDQVNNEYVNEFSEEKFWEKLKRYAITAGIKVVYVVLILYYTLQKPTIPLWAKGVIIGALGYFIFPLDAIPDLAPVVGYADDFGVLIMSIGSVLLYIDEQSKQQARQKLKDWFGDYDEEELLEVDKKMQK